jgi:phage tail-like protein
VPGLFLLVLLFILSGFGEEAKADTFYCLFFLTYLCKPKHMLLFIFFILLLVLLLLIYFFILKPMFMSNNPLIAYHFRVDWGGTRMGFTEVSGLGIQIEAIEYREGASPDDVSRKIPGLRKFDNITLKRGIVKGDNEFFNWINSKQMGTIERRDITITLLDEQHNLTIVWKVKNAFPVKYTGPSLNASASEIAVESLELTHEGITVDAV